MIWRIAICLILGYAIGCISTGYIVGKAQKVDIRKYGSGNVGTTNALRTLGKKAALITLLGDVLKCAIPVILIKYVFFKELPETDLLGLYTALGAVLGHTFPFYLKFKGGKGIAVLVGTILTFDWRIFLICVATFFLILALTRFVSLGSLVMEVEFVIWVALTRPGDWHMLALSAVFAVLAFYTHRENIKRLLHGTENKIGQKVKIPREEEAKENEQ
ncbi:MAG: glycerol-3-phosphate 1-O-acyltransferase PlsY [Lachnospiraceae bacterium]|nr:glycerol-3-phosphate 1-O-acyltransferase PlsY [Lachnospiraceae bacterium]